MSEHVLYGIGILASGMLAGMALGGIVGVLARCVGMARENVKREDNR